MKILVTGSSGFIGFHLVRKLLDNGHYIVGIDDQNDYYDQSLKTLRNNLLNNSKYQFIKTNINSLSIEDDNFDMVIHLAAQAGVRVPQEKKHTTGMVTQEKFISMQ